MTESESQGAARSPKPTSRVTQARRLLDAVADYFGQVLLLFLKLVLVTALMADEVPQFIYAGF